MGPCQYFGPLGGNELLSPEYQMPSVLTYVNNYDAQTK